MNTTIRGHNLRVTVVMALLAVLLLVALVFALRPAPTTSDSDASPANHAMSARGNGGSSSPKIQSTVTSKWLNAWAIAAFTKACGEFSSTVRTTEKGRKR